MSIRILAPLLPLAFAIACSENSESEDSGVIYERPQVLPTINPICLNTMHIEVGKSVNQPISLRNDGRQTLEIMNVMLIEDERSHFTVQGPDQMTVPSLDFAL